MAIRAGVVGWGELGMCHAEYLISAEAQSNGVVSRRSGPKLEVPVYSTIQGILPHRKLIIAQELVTCQR